MCSAAAGEQESTPSPHFPSDLNYQIIRASAFFSLLPLAVVSVFKKTRETRFTVQDLALIFFFLLYSTSYPAAFEPSSAVVFLFLECNRTQSGRLHRCFHSIPLTGKNPFLLASCWAPNIQISPFSQQIHKSNTGSTFTHFSLLSTPIPYSPFFIQSY